MNKRKQRTEEYHQAIRAQVLNDVVVNDLEQHNFDRLVRSGIIREGRASQEPKTPRGGVGLL